jgi:hypothetical protein
MILYIEKALPGHEMEQAEAHLTECRRCRESLKKTTSDLRFIMQKMDILEPDKKQTPVFDTGFARRRQSRKRFGFAGFFGSRRTSYVLRLAFLAVPVLIVALFVLAVHVTRPGKSDSLPALPEVEFSIRSVKMEEQPARTYIVKDEENGTTMIWVEKI